MKKNMVIFGFLCSMLGLILSLTTYSNYAFIPCILALLGGLFAYYTDRHLPYPKKSIQIIFIITIIALSLTTYRALLDLAN
ncbi:hypothetical protein [Aegicerativicinus sediminis]